MLTGSSEKCAPCAPKKADIFKLGDIVMNIYTKEVFSIGAVAKAYGDELIYTHKLQRHQNFDNDLWVTGHNLVRVSIVNAQTKLLTKKKTAKKKQS